MEGQPLALTTGETKNSEERFQVKKSMDSDQMQTQEKSMVIFDHSKVSYANYVKNISYIFSTLPCIVKNTLFETRSSLMGSWGDLIVDIYFTQSIFNEYIRKRNFSRRVTLVKMSYRWK